MSLTPRRPSFLSFPAGPQVATTFLATALAVAIMGAGPGCAKISKDPGLGTASGGANGTGSGGRGGVIIPGSGGAAPLPMDPVTGSKMGPGFNASDMGKLDGSPSGTALKIAYPLDGAIFPSNFGPVTVQVPRQQGQDIARIALTGGNQLDLKYYAVCETGAVGSGCNVTLDAGLTKLFIYPSSTEDVTMTVRLGSKSGSTLSESQPIKIAWANVPLSGGLYYWTTINPGAVQGYTAPDTTDMRGTAVMRYVFKDDEPKRELVWSDRGSPYTTPPFGESPPAQPGTDPNGLRPAWGEGRCIGCHAISPDGKYMAFSIGGADASSWALLNIASPPTLNELDPTAYPQATAVLDILKRYRKGNFATFTTFGPKSDRMVNMYRGKLTLRGVPDLAVTRDDLFATATSERKSDPFWSPDPEGSFFAFVSYDPSQDKPAQTSRLNGDTKTGGQIWVATADATGPHDDAKLVVPRQNDVTSYYPAISNDARMMVFNRSKCSGPSNPGGYGTNPCDGYDDITATLWLTDPTGSTPPIPLERANGGEQNSNSWPRWSPDNGLFRGQKLYWLAFSSRRPYGLQINVGTSSSNPGSPQLWFAAVMTGDEFTKDPSHAAVWLPKQNLDETNAKPTGNHVPQWVKFAVAIE